MVGRTIGELDGLSSLEELAQEYRIQFGIGAFNLSHWDPSDQTTTSLLKHLKLPPPPLAIPYIYSDPGRKPKTLKLLGFNSMGQTCSFVQSGTSATVLVAWWLRSIGVKRVLILCPAYFSVFYVLQVVGMEYKHLHLRRAKDGWRLPTDEIAAELKGTRKVTAVWLTNPVYCTGTYCPEDDVAFLSSLLRTGVAVIADECLCLSGRELGPTFAWNNRFVGIYSPHKSVCINAVKFAAVVTSVNHEKFFDRWSDVLVGNLTASNYSAISHFCDGQNFFDFLAAFVEIIDAVRNAVKKIISNEGPCLETDANSIGHYISCYAPRIRASKGLNAHFSRKLIWETGALVIPGTTNHFPTEVGFSFRINLARASPQFFSALHRTIRFLEIMSQNPV